MTIVFFAANFDRLLATGTRRISLSESFKDLRLDFACVQLWPRGLMIPFRALRNSIVQSFHLWKFKMQLFLEDNDL